MHERNLTSKSPQGSKARCFSAFVFVLEGGSAVACHNLIPRLMPVSESAVSAARHPRILPRLRQGSLGIIGHPATLTKRLQYEYSHRLPYEGAEKHSSPSADVNWHTCKTSSVRHPATSLGRLSDPQVLAFHWWSLSGVILSPADLPSL